MFATLVYVLCAVTSVLCTALLWRGYQKSRVRMLLWSAWGFVGLALNNVMLAADQVFALHIPLWARSMVALIGILVLVYGLIRESA
jgi:hypothetical protein